MYNKYVSTWDYAIHGYFMSLLWFCIHLIPILKHESERRNFVRPIFLYFFKEAFISQMLQKKTKKKWNEIMKETQVV